MRHDTSLLPTAPLAAPVEIPTLSPARQLLWDAANYMEKHGKNGLGESWCGEKVCAVVAIARADGNRGCTDPVWNAWQLLKRQIGSEEITVWSDRSSQATVVAAMRAAAVS